MSIALTDRSVVEVSGADRLGFLDGLLTCATRDLAPGSLTYGALLTPQGKILTDLFVHTREDHLFLDLPASVADDILRRLTMYKLRAAVNVAATDARVLVSADDAPADPRGAGLGGRTVGAGEPGPAEAYDTARIAAGVPDAVVDFELGSAFPHDANMDLTGGVDFRKGCFVGQEVVSRMRHRGTARRRTVVVDADAPLPETGADISVDGRVIGRLGTVVGRRGLAIVRIDRTTGSADAGGVPVRLTPPPGAPFTLSADPSSAREASEGTGA